jgi:hypothetical protein
MRTAHQPSGNRFLAMSRLLGGIGFWRGRIAIGGLTLLFFGTATPCQAVNARSALSGLPLVFEPNLGQGTAAAVFLARAPRLAVSVEREAIVLSLPTQPVSKAGASQPESNVALRLELVGAARKSDIVALNPLAGRSNYFTGSDPAGWHTDVPQYERVKYVNLYPGIDLVLYGRGGTVEYDFLVSPGADPEAIKFRLKGADRVKIDEHGDLVAALGRGFITQRRPRVFAQRGPSSREVDGRYEVRDGVFSFALGPHDQDERLVIDPVVVASTYLGGDRSETPLAIALDAQGNIYLTGRTDSSNFPIGNSYQGDQFYEDVFVTKLDASASQIIYSTYLGSTAGPAESPGWFEAGFGIAVDALGNAYIAGDTGECDFPTTPGAFQGACQPIRGSDVFVTKLSPAGNALVYSTYIHGSDGGTETPRAIAVDALGRAYVAGLTDVASFPVTGGSFQTTYAGGSDGFVVVLNPTGTALVSSTFLGGHSSDYILAMTLDDQGNAYVTGETLSNDFPVRNARQAGSGGAQDAFVGRLSSSLAILEYSSYLGGSGSDAGTGIARDPAGNLVVSGYTSSPDFPRAHALQPTFGGEYDAFVTKLNPAGDTLVYSTYIGGRDYEGLVEGVALAVDSAGNAYITGSTRSPDFPIKNAIQPDFAGKDDAFLTKISASGASILHSSFLGGSEEDAGWAIAVGPSAVYVAGSTVSVDFPVVAALQPEHAAESFPGIYEDAFFVKIVEGCVPSRTALCLNGGRFMVTARFDAGGGNSGTAQVFQLTPDTGYLWFFNSSNVEAIVKVLNGCGLGGHYWVFAGGLTNVNVVLTVIDTETGEAKTYTNPQNTKFQPIQDTNAFATCSSSASTTPGAVRDVVEREAEAMSDLLVQATTPPSWQPFVSDGLCTPSPTALCLNGGRFQVTAHFDTGSSSGMANVFQLTPDTGYLWFFNSANVEAVVKVLDGCGLGGHYWVFAGGLTNVNVVLTVTDTHTNLMKTYVNSRNTKFQPIQDTNAFATCP